MAGSDQGPFDFSRWTGADAAPGRVPGPPAPEPGDVPTFAFDPGSGDPGSGDPAWAGTADVLTAARPPLTWVVAAGVVAAAGLVAALLLGGRIAVSVAAWVLCGPVAIGLLAVFTLRDTAARARPLYTAPSWATTAYWTALGVSLCGVLVTALRIADWAGRL